jgi:hypothetical protein
MVSTPQKPTDQPATELHWLPAYAQLIADGANRWAYLEYYINSSIWLLADLRPAIGACLTSQMYTLNAKLSGLLALLKLRKAPQELLDRINKFASQSRDALEARNRMVHDVWLNDYIQPTQMGKLRITADKVLRYNIESINAEELRQDVQKIETRRLEAGMIKHAIELALPSLPEMSQSELYPITETHVD